MAVRGVLTDVTAQQMRGQREQAAATAERQRLAQDLHDAVSQTLYSMAAIAEALPSGGNDNRRWGARGCANLGRLASGALAEMRSLLLELRPAAIEEEALEELLRRLANAVRAHARSPST